MDVTALLSQAREGDAASLDSLARVLYPELKALARRRSRGGPGMGATTLVNEAFLRMLAGGRLASGDRQQFLGLMATIMRRIIVDEVRYLTAGKRFGDDVTLAETLVGDDAQQRVEFLLDVDEMLTTLGTENPRLARVFECRYFAGMTTAETAEGLGISERSVERDWSAARARMAQLIDD